MTPSSGSNITTEFQCSVAGTTYAFTALTLSVWVVWNEYYLICKKKLNAGSSDLTGTGSSSWHHRGIDPRGFGVLTPWKYVGGVRVCFDPKKVTCFHSKLLLDNSASFTSSTIKELDVGLLVLMIWPELCTAYSSRCHHRFRHPLLQWTPANPGSPGKWPLKRRERERERESKRERERER